MTLAFDPTIYGEEIALLLEHFAMSATDHSSWADPRGSSNGQFDEDICALFDDLLFRDFVRENWLGLSKEDWMNAIGFERRFSSFLNTLPDRGSSLSFVRDTRWKSLSSEAGRIACIIRGKLQQT